MCAAAGVTVLLAVAYAGRGEVLTWWYLRALDSGDASTRVAAVRALGNLGSARAVPKVIALMDSADRNLVLAAVEGIRQMGPAGADAVQKLVELAVRRSSSSRADPAGQRQLHNAVRETLLGMRDQCVPYVFEEVLRLHRRGWGKNERYRMLLFLILDLSPGSLPFLMTRLESPDPVEASCVRDCIVFLGRTAVPALEQELLHGNGEAARWAPCGLTAMAANAIEEDARAHLAAVAVALFSPVLSEDQARSRAATVIAETLDLKEPLESSLVPLLTTSLVFELRRACVARLARGGRLTERAIRYFTSCLENQPPLRQDVAEALAGQGIRAVHALIRLLDSPDAVVRAWAASTLRELAARDEAGAQAIRGAALLRGGEVRDRLEEALVLAGKGSPVKAK